MTKVIVANFGNGSLALIQWAIENEIDDCIVVAVDTGWQSQFWREHCSQIFAYLTAHDMAYQLIKSPNTFAESVLDRGSFPSKKFQWCAPFLKGLPINDYLDEIDPLCDAEILLAKQRCLSRANRSLISGQSSSYYQDRVLTYPLLDFSIEERDHLITNAGFTVLSYASEECFPCIHSTKHDLNRLSKEDKSRVTILEEKINQSMSTVCTSLVDSTQEKYDLGCGNIWGCGD